jgi:DNA-binding transcriptional LysR family regulator
MSDQSGLREFVAVVEHGSFTAAADALNVSTSFVSREVKRLAERLKRTEHLIKHVDRNTS